MPSSAQPFPTPAFPLLTDAPPLPHTTLLLVMGLACVILSPRVEGWPWPLGAPWLLAMHGGVVEVWQQLTGSPPVSADYRGCRAAFTCILRDGMDTLQFP